jgi:hypothetical protein
LKFKARRETLRIHADDKFLQTRFLDRSEWKKGLQPDRKGGLIWYIDGSNTKQALELECFAMEQGGNLVLALGNTQEYSGQSICH